MASPIWLPTRYTGLRAASASWNTIARRDPRSSRRSCSVASSRLVPLYTTSPSMRARLGRSPRMAMDVTLFPEPDSPTMPRTSFSKTSKDTPSTALTTPSSVGKWTERSRTESTGSPAAVGDEVSFSRSTKGSTGRSPSVDGLWVKGVAEAVPEVVDGEDGEQDRQPREVDEVGRRGPDRAFGLGEHVPPRHRGRLDAEGEERERGLGDEGQAQHQGGVHGEVPDGVRTH